MRQFVINELSKDESEKIKVFLQGSVRQGGLPSVFWLAIPDDLLAEAQQGHMDCGPFSFAIEFGDDFVSFEFLVRSQDNLHCSCTAYASMAQQEFLLNFVDKMVQETAIKS